MLLKTLREHFYTSLEQDYPETEIQTFFNILADCFLKLKGFEIPLHLYASISGKKVEKFDQAIKRLKKQEPIQYITGATEFYGLPFKVNEHTLIPRPETEELVQRVIEATADTDVISILDIGTGTGCIAISLAKNKPDASVYAIDVSKKALAVAKINAKLNEVNPAFRELDILNWQDAAETLDFEPKTFDVIVSNPPYVRELEKAHMSANVLKHEPALALYVEDADPLIFYSAITNFATTYLKENGCLFFEINQYLGAEMMELLENSGFESVSLQKDIFGNDRMVSGVKKRLVTNGSQDQ
ncbi:peptide chain release factor N(5)-glutamine methyltransferase [Gelidibacter salicanalis]|uniref:Release factor glutamine methyltransferase n=1 Tax=Gelidibacter salicanalis TaxID=291193 RepID=A0A5C7AGJ1_9FLAO|nr:peptide chain release factor N(5)-glutamine methyltransferase [Gelidibacter salicanalis]TXE07658.1 peptide chain release factor N(5)-glutamine methyltransferase [Gelidibacter salicanalis]